MNYEYGKTGDDAFWKTEYEKMLAEWVDYEDTDNYLYVLIDNLSSTIVTKSYNSMQQEVIRDYVSNSNVVTKNKDAYKDLIQE